MTQEFLPTKMNMFSRLKCTRIIRGLNSFFYSVFFLIFLAITTALTNWFSLELYFYYLIITIAIYVLIFCRDLLPFAPMFLFCYISPSPSNNPADHEQSIFSFAKNGKQLLILSLIVFIVLIIKLSLDKDHGFVTLFTRKRKLFLGILILSLSFLLSGLGSEGYGLIYKRNLTFIALELCCLFFLYFLFTATIDWQQVDFEYFGYMGMLLGLTVLVELTKVYFVNYEKIIAAGKYSKIFLVQGWGKSNNIGCLLAISVPCSMLLAVKKRFGFFAIIISTVLLFSIIFTLSRGSLLFGGLIYVVGLFVLLVKTKSRLKVGITIGIIILSLLIVFICFRNRISQYWNKYFINFLSSNSRLELYEQGCADYRKYPVFGGSFYLGSYPDRMWQNKQLDSLLPPLLHNTIIQIMASCGAFGLFAYIFHRYQTAKLLFVKPSIQKTFVGLSILVLLLTSLLDCHLFNFGPGLFYSIALCFLENGNNKQNEVKLQ